MKRDMELVRAILLAMEDSPSTGPGELVIPDYDTEAVMYHLKIMREAGLIKAVDASSADGL